MSSRKFWLFAILAVVLASAPVAVYQTVSAATNGDDHHDGDHHDGDDDHDDDDDDGNHGPQLLVDNDKVQCPNAQFTSIQAAVTAAPAGATINVCPGTYPETVRIAKRLTVRGIRVGNENLILINPAIAASNTTSLSSGLPAAAIVLVERTANVTLDDLTVDGANNTFGGCAVNLIGIFYRNASGKITNSAVRNIRLGVGLGGCQSGLGIFAQSGNEPGVTPGARLLVTNTSVHDYQKNGITGNENGTELTAIGNAVTGIGATPLIAQNGIQIAFGARGSIEGNAVINNNFSGCTPSVCNFTASNVLVFSETSGVKVLRNNLGKSQVNIFFGGEGALQPIRNGLIEGNTIFDSDVFDGIYINGNNNTARKNTIFNSDEASIFIDGSNNRINDNTFNEAPIGVQVGSGTGNQISGNRYYNIGLRVFPASAASSSSLAAPQTVLSRAPVSAIRP